MEIQEYNAMIIKYNIVKYNKPYSIHCQGHSQEGGSMGAMSPNGLREKNSLTPSKPPPTPCPIWTCSTDAGKSSSII